MAFRPILCLTLYISYFDMHTLALRTNSYGALDLGKTFLEIFGPLCPSVLIFYLLGPVQTHRQPMTMILDKVKSQRVYVTLLGPRNETLLGQLNMTDFQSMSRTGQQDNVVVKDGEAKHYDSRGAAYYICVFILVYALAIVMFVVLLARRRHSEQNANFGHLPKSDILHYYNAENASSVRETAAVECCDLAKSDFSANHHMSMMGSQKTFGINKLVDNKNGKGRVDGGLTPDELITLIQVLPGGGDEPRLDNYWANDMQSDEIQQSSRQDQKCRWSIGPDGNLFILQVDENDSCTKFGLENNYDQACMLNMLNVATQKYVHHEEVTEALEETNQQNSVNADVNGSVAIYLDSHETYPVFSNRINSTPSEEKCFTKDICTKLHEDAVCITKCDSVSLLQQDFVITDNNYNCDFENPWGLPKYPEIQKLVHVTSV